jgi:hypothetical protein
MLNGLFRSKNHLRYLFVATFKDGSVIKQTQEDKSPTTPGKNCFYDVLQRMPEVRTFEFIGNGVRAGVNLETGHFSMNGATFLASDPSLIANLNDIDGFRLVYFKRHRHTLSNYTEVSHGIEYHLGWQVTLDGKNYQQTIALN